jgi:drug/metabolite transporter (DMT)-like permease
MAKGKNAFAVAAALLAVFFWGMSFVWVKIVFIQYRPLTTIFLRLLIATCILGAVYALNLRRERIRRKDLPLLLLLALCEPFLYFIGEGFGLQRVSATLGALIISTIPVFVPLAAVLVLKEKLATTNYAGLLLSFTGVVIMVVNPDLSFAAAPAGVALMFTAVLAAVCYITVLKKVSARYTPFTIVLVQNALGVVFFAPLFGLFELDHFGEVRPTGQTIGALVALAVFASTLAFILFVRAMNQLGVTRTGAFNNLIPVVTAVAAWALLGEVITLRALTGILMVLAGVFLVQVNFRSRTGTQERE